MDGEDDAEIDRRACWLRVCGRAPEQAAPQLVAPIGTPPWPNMLWCSQDSGSPKAAYRFFSNDRVCEADILAGHFQSTFERAVATRWPCFCAP